MAGVDQLAAQLRLLPVRPEAVTELLPIRVHPPAHPARRLIHIGVDPLVLQGQRRRQPGDAAADDGDPRRGRRPRRPGQRQRPRHRRGRPRRTGTLEELPPRHPRHLLALPQLLNPDPQLRRGPMLPRKALQRPHQRRPCHQSSRSYQDPGDDLASRPAKSRVCRSGHSVRPRAGRAGIAGYILGLTAVGQVSRGSPGGRWTGTGGAAWTWPWTRSAGSAPG